MPDAHSRYSPSSAHRWLNCSASMAFEDALEGEEQTSPYAAEGTAAHALAERVLRTGIKSCKGLLGEEIAPGHVVDHEMAHYVQIYVDDIRRQGGELFVEAEVRYDQWVPTGWGTSDAGIIIPSRKLAIINDLKYGRGVRVDAEDNVQMKLYALGFYQDYGFLYDIEVFELIIHQPRLDHRSTWSIALPELLTFAEEAKAAAQAIETGERRFNPGEKTCQWCPGKPTCKAYANFIASQIGAEFDYDTGEIRTVDVGSLSPEELGRIYGSLDHAAHWIQSVKAHVDSLLGSNVAVPGWKRVKGGRRTRFWKDETAAENTLKSMRLKQEDMYTQGLRSPAQLEKVLTPRRWKRLQNLVGWSEGKPTVVPESDPRPAINTDLDADFDYAD